MPRIIDFGAPYGHVEFPDGTGDDEIVARYDALEAERKRQASRAQTQAKFLADQANEIGGNTGDQGERVAIRTGLGALSGFANAPVAAGEVLRGASKIIPDTEAPVTGTFGMPNPTLSGQFVKAMGEALSSFGAKKQAENAELAASVGGGVPGAIGESLADTAATSIQTLPAALFGMGPAAIAAGTQQYGLSKKQFRDRYMQLNPGVSEDEADSKAELPAAASAIMTGVLTRTFGGTEKLIDSIVNRGLKVAGIQQVLKEAARSAYLEFSEETLDQAAQGYFEKAFIDPSKTDSEIWNEAIMAGGAGMAVGGVTSAGTAGIAKAADSITDAITKPSRMRYGAELRRQFISDAVDRGELLNPQGTPDEAPQWDSAQPIKESPQPIVRIPIKIRAADGNLRDGEFTGYYDLTELGKGVVASVGWLNPDGKMTHGMLKPGEEMIGQVPTFDEWKNQQSGERGYGTYESLVALVDNFTDVVNRSPVPIDHMESPVVRHLVNNGVSMPRAQAFAKRIRLGESPREVLIASNDSVEALLRGESKSIRDAVNGLSQGFNSATIGDLLRLIAADKKSDWAPMAAAMLKAANKDNLSVQSRLEKLPSRGVYRFSDNAVGLHPEWLNYAIVLHESAHGLTSQEIAQNYSIPSDSGQKMIESLRKISSSSPSGTSASAIREIVQSYLAALKHHGLEAAIEGLKPGPGERVAKAASSAGIMYGFGDLDEFIAETWSNPDFQKMLQQVRLPDAYGKSTLKTLWDKIVNAVRKLLGWAPHQNSALASVLESSAKLMASSRKNFSWNSPWNPGPTPSPQAQEMEKPITPTTFGEAGDVQAAKSAPGISAEQQRLIDDLARVQAGMSPDSIVGWLMATATDAADAFAKKALDYIQDRRFLTPGASAPLSSMPSSTPAEKRAKRVAGASILAHYGIDRTTDLELSKVIAEYQEKAPKIAEKIQKMQAKNIQAGFMEGMFKAMTSGYKLYLERLVAAAPANATLDSQYRQRIANAERRMNEQLMSPIAVQKALAAIAKNVPSGVLANGSAADVVNWIVSSGVLNGVVSAEVKEWLALDDGTGVPALQQYDKLVQDLTNLRAIQLNRDAIQNELDQFAKWFNPSGSTKKVSAKRFAESYFKFRTGRDRAAQIAAMLEKEIDDFDTKLRGSQQAVDRLRAMMSSPEYVATVREAARDADISVRAVGESSLAKIGLIERDKTLGRWRITGPESGSEYVIDLFPTSGQEAENRQSLSAFAVEASQWADANRDTNPLLADEYDSLVDYINKYLLDPTFDPKQGFTVEAPFRIPGTTIRVNVDPFEIFSYFTGPIFKIVRDVIERVGGRAMRQVWLDANELDVTMRKLEAINKDKRIGFEAQTQAAIRAMESHGWSPEMFSKWNTDVAEKILAAAQNALSPEYNVGDVIVGSGVNVTPQDIAAIRLIKRWEDAVMKTAPSHVRQKIGDLWVTRSAAGGGRFTVSRIAAPWTRGFMREWMAAQTPDEKVALLSRDDYFNKVVLGYISEGNPEFAKTNPTASGKSPLWKAYRQLGLGIKQGAYTVSTFNDVVDFVADWMISNNMSSDMPSAMKAARNTLLAEITGFVKSFDSNVLNFKSEETFGDVPASVVAAITANNSFTTPRGNLVAPSTFYTYSKFSDAARMRYLGSLRSLLNLKILQSSREAIAAMEQKKDDMERRIAAYQASGMSRGKARKKVIVETSREMKNNEIRYDYLNLVSALKTMRQAFGSLEQFEASTTDAYEHPGVAAFQNATGSVKSMLLSAPQPMVTNVFSAALLGPALFHWQTGQYLKALVDVLPMPAGWMMNAGSFIKSKVTGGPATKYKSGLISELLLKKVADMVASNPVMSKLLKVHAPLWSQLAEMVIDYSQQWRRLQRIADSSGIVTRYNIRNVWKNQADLKKTTGKLLESDDVNEMSAITTAFNAIMSMPGIRHFVEGTKAVAPRLLDNAANYAMIMSFEHELDALKVLAFRAFEERERQAAATGAAWDDMTQSENLLTPSELGIGSYKALNRMRDLFVSLGGLDAVLLDYYKRAKPLTPEQRGEERVIQDEADHAATAMQYVAVSNLATETNRPHWTRGKGSTGFIKSMIGTFMGWTSNMIKQFSKALQTHSKDTQYTRIATNMVTLIVAISLLAAVGAWNWEVGDALTKMIFDVSSARIQLGNIHEPETALAYAAQALVNVVPIIGSTIGSMAGVAFTGRGNPFDLSSTLFQLNMLSDTYKTVIRMIQTGDISLPLADYVKRWGGTLPKAIINRLPTIRGIVANSNAIRALNASAPPGTEIKWGRGGGGEVRYSPYNDEIQRLIASAYEVQMGTGTAADVRQRYGEAIEAVIKSGRKPEDAASVVATALAAKEPIRVLAGREFTPQEEAAWISRMTNSQRGDYQTAVNAWRVLSEVTGKDLGMTTQPGGQGGGGSMPAGFSASIPGASLGGGRRLRLPALKASTALPARASIPAIKPFRPKRTGRRLRIAKTPKLRAPRLRSGTRKSAARPRISSPYSRL